MHKNGNNANIGIRSFIKWKTKNSADSRVGVDSGRDLWEVKVIKCNTDSTNKLEN